MAAVGAPGASYAPLLEPDAPQDLTVRGPSRFGKRLAFGVGLPFAVIATLFALSTVAPTGSRVSLLSSPGQITKLFPASYTGTIVDTSPILKWTLSAKAKAHHQTKVLKGFAAVEYIKKHGVIDRFMNANPEIKKIMWDEHYDGVQTVDMAMAFAKKLTVHSSIDTYMTQKGCTLKKRIPKIIIYTCDGVDKYVKPTHANWDAKHGPGNGFLRVFYHHVFSKLKQFDSAYGWDDCQEAAIYDVGQKKLYLVNKHYDSNWNVDPSLSPIHWVIPQMHYIGVMPIDTAGAGKNFAHVDGGNVAVPVDLDAVFRGKFWSIIKLNTPDLIQNKVERNYLHIH